MNLVSKDELQGIMENLTKEQVVDLLHDAWSDLYRIECRASSHWVYREAAFKEGSWYKTWKNVQAKMQSDGTDLNND